MAERIAWSEARLRSHRDLTSDIRLFEIAPAEAFSPPAPGSHIHVAVQIGDRPGLRSYSTIGSCTDGVLRIAVKRLADTRGGSAYLWSLQPGARLTISPPRNRFALSRGRPEYLLIAGGIGITPIYGMALSLAAAGARLRLLYAARTRGDLAFADELQEQLGNRVEIFTADAGRRMYLPAAFARLPQGAEAYVCGPIGLLDAAKRIWRQAGRPTQDLRFETFGTSGRFAAEAFTVSLPRLGLRIEVPPNRSLLDALEDAGVAMISDCRRGECGLCALRILDVQGIVDHRDVFFSDEEKTAGAKLCTCVSRVMSGSITLDTGDR